MIDFHTHVLPGIDDGAQDTLESIAMLAMSYKQGVSTVFATPHFYPEDNDPVTFLRKRRDSFNKLLDAMMHCSYPLADVKLGAEVAYYSGISQSREIGRLAVQGTPLLLVELPMMPVSDFVLDELDLIPESMGLIPVIAHLDRYMRNFGDYTLIERMQGRKALVQVNSSYFINKSTRKKALSQMDDNLFSFIGTDCHNIDTRPPNMEEVKKVCVNNGYENSFNRLIRRNRQILKRFEENQI